MMKPTYYLLIGYREYRSQDVAAMAKFSIMYGVFGDANLGEDAPPFEGIQCLRP
jgi:hypothetical protein